MKDIFDNNNEKEGMIAKCKQQTNDIMNSLLKQTFQTAQITTTSTPRTTVATHNKMIQ
jgi:hypothetical protein